MVSRTSCGAARLLTAASTLPSSAAATSSSSPSPSAGVPDSCASMALLMVFLTSTDDIRGGGLTTWLLAPSLGSRPPEGASSPRAAPLPAPSSECCAGFLVRCRPGLSFEGSMLVSTHDRRFPSSAGRGSSLGQELADVTRAWEGPSSMPHGLWRSRGLCEEHGTCERDLGCWQRNDETSTFCLRLLTGCTKWDEVPVEQSKNLQIGQT